MKFVSNVLLVIGKFSRISQKCIKIENLTLIEVGFFGSYTANVLPMETTDVVCVQNPVLVYLYFFKGIYCRFYLEKFRIFRVIFFLNYRLRL